CTAGAVAILRDAKALFLPGKAANAGGVAVSGMEMAQNAQRLPWTSERVGTHLQEIMRDVHTRCVRNAGEGKPVDYVRGANVAGFLRLAEAVEAQGIL
ncbi:MAG TPA: glutamate dehydrogenase, partial [Polyangiaceae bacterium LLY-WYZ-15_(1-7)]|nr:glutamate dehydrogenase [Polyangiaceae bacterium LLY-WYZ-15_(1-7)]